MREIETIEKVGDNSKVWGVKSAKDFRTFLNNKIKHFVKCKNKEYELVIRQILMAYDYFEEKSVGLSIVNGWKGKSGIVNLIKKPDRVIVIRFQKPDKNSEPKEVRIEITKEEINAVIIALNRLFNEQPIKTRDIAMIYSNVLNLGHIGWKDFFSDRGQHNKLCNILCVLEVEGLINYNGGKTTILKDNLEIENIL